MEELIKGMLKKIKTYSLGQIDITTYCKGRMGERSIDETLLKSTLFSKNLYYVKEQLKPHKGKTEKRYKLIFKISSKYSLIIIVAFYPKVLKVVNVIKTSKGVEKKMAKENIGVDYDKEEDMMHLFKKGSNIKFSFN
ncbi:MAG TPA: hypothetical protein ENG87_01655, partial [Candidatus Pacearchaeota archaeon]|nr:hypothetical protein [Candidatus Pacearchaeota archaeon]